MKSEPTVSRRWDVLRPVIGKVLAAYVPRPVEVLGDRGNRPGRRRRLPDLGLELHPGAMR